MLFLDSLRGFAILLVVVGHLIQFNYDDALMNPIFNIIYSFHMPLFFFLSGTSRAISESRSVDSIKCVTNEILAKLLSLIVPSIIWTLLVPLFFQKEIYPLIEGGGRLSGYWFLNVLFVISVLFSIISYLKRLIKSELVVLALILVAIIVCFAINVYRIPLVYFLLFLFGYIWQRYSLSERVPSIIICGLSIVFLLMVGKYEYGNSLAGDPNRVWLLLPLSCIASIVSHWIFSRNHLNNRLLVLFGKHSLGIYLCHFFFTRIPVLECMQYQYSNILQFFGLLLIAIAISLVCVLIQKVVSEITWLNGMLYGNWKFLKNNANNR